MRRHEQPDHTESQCYQESRTALPTLWTGATKIVYSPAGPGEPPVHLPWISDTSTAMAAEPALPACGGGRVVSRGLDSASGAARQHWLLRNAGAVICACAALPVGRVPLGPVRRSPRLEPFKEIIDGWLRADLDAPRKQRHTVTRIWHRLMDEHQVTDASYPVVRAYVAGRRPQVLADRGRNGQADV